ncbi:hypothetical protein M885DRAFT_522224 [Pelagophyceae sp. CCMP2097]|nr:hypothetical protein M885DRAFT_522224 [Pelagophyceae sp. CCMP2097]
MDAADSLRALGGPCRWDEAALDALEYGRGDVVALIFRSRGNDIDSKVQGGCYGRQILARRGYRLAALGLSRKSYETGDTLFHLAVRNDAPIEFLVELLARGARLDVRNAKRQTALDIDVRAGVGGSAWETRTARTVQGWGRHHRGERHSGGETRNRRTQGRVRSARAMPR